VPRRPSLAARARGCAQAQAGCVQVGPCRLGCALCVYIQWVPNRVSTTTRKTKHPQNNHTNPKNNNPRVPRMIECRRGSTRASACPPSHFFSACEAALDMTCILGIHNIYTHVTQSFSMVGSVHRAEHAASGSRGRASQFRRRWGARRRPCRRSGRARRRRAARGSGSR
jgi:hypothetical protein